MPDLFEALTRYLLGDAIAEARYRCTRQYWRAWLLSNSFKLPEHTNTEEDHSQQVDAAPLPTWLYDQPGSYMSRGHSSGYSEMTYASVHEKIWCTLRDAISVAVLGRVWIEGVRDDIFKLVHDNQGEYYTDAEVRAIADFVDKGGCAGVQSALLQCVRDEQFKSLVMDLMGLGTLKQICQIVAASLCDCSNQPPQDVIDQAVSNALDFLMGDTFHGMGGAWDDVLRGSPQGTISFMITNTMSGRASPESFEAIVGFCTEQFSKAPIEQRAKKVVRGFWEILSSMESLIAAAIINELALATLKSKPMAEPKLDDILLPNDLFIVNCRIVEMVREGIMALGDRLTPGWRSSIRRAMYWCLEAEASMTGWGLLESGQTYDYRNQDRWEESCILMDVKEGQWPLF